jgi:protein-S-isoprenylcysteine O-methyltransferase
MDVPGWIGLTYFLSELLLTLTRRSRGTGVKEDRSTLRVLWLIILLSIATALLVTIHCPAAAILRREICIILGLVFFVAGLALRWWAIIVLGRFFTVDVQIAPDHQLIDSGPFRVMRHPSYTGVLLAFAGFGLSLANWAALLVLLLPITAALIHRIIVEEAALRRALGQRYLDYTARTSRLIPGIY